jgi:hypothetical protein
LAQFVAQPDLISLTNKIMKAWETGDEETYKAAAVTDCKMTIPAYGLDVTGIDGIWSIRKSMKAEGSLDIHTVRLRLCDCRGGPRGPASAA